jgi:lambda repressor-like predicted transcriptional regulator
MFSLQSLSLMNRSFLSLQIASSAVRIDFDMEYRGLSRTTIRTLIEVWGTAYRQAQATVGAVANIRPSPIWRRRFALQPRWTRFKMKSLSFVR